MSNFPNPLRSSSPPPTFTGKGGDVARPLGKPESKASFGKLDARPPDAANKPLLSLSPQLPQASPKSSTTTPDSNAIQDTKQGRGVAPIGDARYLEVAATMELIARRAKAAMLPPDTPAGTATAQAGLVITGAIDQGFSALLRDVRLKTDADALALIATLAPTMEVFDERPMPGSGGRDVRLGTSLRACANTALLISVRAKRPIDPDRLADDILAYVAQPRHWVRSLMVSRLGTTPLDRSQHTAMLERIERNTLARQGDTVWQEQALVGMAEAQQRAMACADAALSIQIYLNEAGPKPFIVEAGGPASLARA
ncbi:MAG TPA: hypothetical protein VLJ86_25495, partial [Ramlibacter sp.]|nr:hypothetical protein [Ramlibacter sp.]